MAWFAITELLLRLFPLPRVSRLLSVRLATDTGGGRDTHGVSTGAGASTEALHIRDRVVRVARHWPFAGGPCLRESLVLARLLRGGGAVVRIGAVRTGRGRVRAHAWVEIDGQPITDTLGYVPFGVPSGAA